jgi:ribonuclease VapC
MVTVSDYVLDASALLAFMNREPGMDVVADVLPDSSLSAVNLTEVVSRLLDLGFTPNEIRGHFEELELNVVPLDEVLALEAGFLRTATRKRGLSLGDRACLVLARSHGVPALTADRAWSSIDVGVDIHQIRD